MAPKIELGAVQNREMIRSKFIPKPFNHTFTCNTGEIRPAFHTIEVMPHDTWKVDTGILVRQQTPLETTMDQAYVNYAWYYVMHQKTWNHWDEMMGENKTGKWKNTTVYSCPKIDLGANGVEFGSILDTMGIRPGKGKNLKVNALALRAYLNVCNEYYRDQNIEEPIEFPTDDTTITYVTGGDWTTGGKPYMINRKADYFSTALPEPYKGENVGISLTGELPVTSTGLGKETAKFTMNYSGGNQQLTSIMSGSAGTYNMQGKGTAVSGSGVNWRIREEDGWSAQAEAISIDLMSIRDAATTLHIYETDGRCGSRAPETAWARWGVEVDMLAMDRPMYLGGAEIPLNIYQVAQNGATTQGSALGQTAGFGHTIDARHSFTQSFKYHGTIICMVAIRAEHTYQQGIQKEWLKFDRFDFWHPEFAGLSDQPIHNYEIWFDDNMEQNMKAWGYAERGAEYKNFPSRISGEMRSEHPQSLDRWHYADYYDAKPDLSPAWMKENPNYVDRTIIIQSSEVNQWLVNFSAKFELTRAMPVKSIPGIGRI